MISLIGRHIIPHKGNKYRPHLLHGAAARYLVLFLILVEALVFLAMNANLVGGLGSTAAVLPAVLGDLTNFERAKESLTILKENPVLDESARLKAEDMAAKAYFAHTSPEGKTPWYWLDKVGYNYDYAGENLAINFSDSVDVTQAWMNSPTHRANIEKAQYTEIGTGVATGTFEGISTVFVAQVYAHPAIHKPSSVTITRPAKSAVQAIGTQQVLGTSLEPVPPRPTLFQKIIASPRHAGNLVFIFIAIFVALIMTLTIIVQASKKKLNHRDLITNVILIIAFVGAFALTNYYFAAYLHPIQTSFAAFSQI